jgi:hypothetical protein
MTFSFDNEEIGRIEYPEGGMWQHGDFETDFPGNMRYFIIEKLTKKSKK